MKKRKASSAIFLLAILICTSIACTGISISFNGDQNRPAAKAANDNEPQTEPSPILEEAPPAEDAPPASGSDGITGTEPENPFLNLPSLIELETAWEAGTLDLSTIPDVTAMLENEWKEGTLLPAIMPEVPTNILPTNITGVAIGSLFNNDFVLSWYDYGGRASGSSQELGSRINPYDGKCTACYFILPTNMGPDDVIDIAFANPRNVLYYFRNGTVSVGSPVDADKVKKQQAFSLPPGKYPYNIVGIGSTCNHPLNEATVYAWYDDGTVSAGSYLDLDSYREPYPYTLPAGKTIEVIDSMAIACSDDHVYVWYWDGTVSSGMSDDLGMYRAPAPFSTPQE